jgi:hypothetical protein
VLRSWRRRFDRRNELVTGMTKYTDEDRARIVATARELLEKPVEPYVPVEEPMIYKRRERMRMPPQRLDTAPREAATAPDFSGWEVWVSARIADALVVERQQLLAAVVEVMGDALGTLLGDSIERERARFDRELRELRVESAKLSSTLDELHRMLADDKRKTVIDLPSLSSLRSVN